MLSLSEPLSRVESLHPKTSNFLTLLAQQDQADGLQKAQN